MTHRRPLPFLLVALLCSLLVMFTVWAQTASAQPAPPDTAATAPRVDTCTGQPTGANVVLWEDFAPKGPPLQCAQPSTPSVRFNAAGITAWRYCKRADGSGTPQWAAATWGAIGSTPGLASALWAAGPNPDDATVQALARRFASTPLDAPELKPVWCPHWPEIAAGIPPKPAPVPVPPATAWRVAGSTAFWLRNGALAPGAGLARVGTPCDCAVPFVAGLTTYCPWAGAPANAVARCTR